MTTLKPHQDAFGRMLLDHLRGRPRRAVLERDDGMVECLGPAFYFSGRRQWPAHQRKALRLARGRVLDVGCGAGRVALHFQAKGRPAAGIDNSPLAVQVCRERGLRQVHLMSLTQLSRRVGVFDTLVLFGGNFGLVENPRRARWLLRRLGGMTTDRARILTECRDPYPTDDPVHLAYHRRNRRAGRMGGRVRIRVRYRQLATPWFDWLLVSKDELRAILAATGWRVGRFIDAPGATYVAVIDKQR